MIEKLDYWGAAVVALYVLGQIDVRSKATTFLVYHTFSSPVVVASAPWCSHYLGSGRLR